MAALAGKQVNGMEGGTAMKRPEEIEGYELPLHVALTQPVLMGGAPRTFAILNGTLALVIGMVTGDA